MLGIRRSDLKLYVDFLNEHGVLSALHLMRKWKKTRVEAKEILNQIVDYFENVRFMSDTLIYIEDRDMERLTNPIRSKRKSKWKDVTKP